MAGKNRPVRILEVGCGSGVYLRHAAEANPLATGIGVDMHEEVVELAAANLAVWGIADRFLVVQADIRRGLPSVPDIGSFDLVTLYNNIYYFTPEERMALFRLVVGECARFPEMGDIFYRTGPQVVGKWLTEFFRGVMARGLVAGDDPERTAFQFIHALRGDIYMQVLLNPTRSPTEAELEAHIDFVVQAFLEGARPR